MLRLHNQNLNTGEKTGRNRHTDTDDNYPALYPSTVTASDDIDCTIDQRQKTFDSLESEWISLLKVTLILKESLPIW